MENSTDHIIGIFTFSIIMIILFLFMYNKSFNEFFNIKPMTKMELNLDLKNNILWLTDNLDNVTQLSKGTFLNKSEDLINSNEKITRNFKYSGFIFRPDKNLKNIKVGLYNKDIDKEGMSYHFDIKENNTFNIVELNNNNYTLQDIHFCSVVKLNQCMEQKDIYKYNQGDFLGIIIDNGTINYLIITVNEGTYTGNIIHKSLNQPFYPLQPTIFNTENDNLIEESYWITNKYVGENYKWSVEVINNDSYDNEPLPPKESLTEEEEEVEVEVGGEILKLDGNNRIIITNINYDNNILTLNTKNNLTITNIKYLKNILINIVFNDKILSIPYTDYVDTLNIDIIKIDLSNYEKYFINNDNVTVVIELVRSLKKQENNFISNTVKL